MVNIIKRIEEARARVFGMKELKNVFESKESEGIRQRIE